MMMDVLVVTGGQHERGCGNLNENKERLGGLSSCIFSLFYICFFFLLILHRFYITRRCQQLSAPCWVPLMVADNHITKY